MAGINGEKVEKSLSLDLSFLKNKKADMIASGDEITDEPSFARRNMIVPETGKVAITLKGNDGFVAVFSADAPGK